jgi:hypothetical protein
MTMVPAMHPMRITRRLDWVVVVTFVVTIRGSHCKVVAGLARHLRKAREVKLVIVLILLFL